MDCEDVWVITEEVSKLDFKFTVLVEGDEALDNMILSCSRSGMIFRMKPHLYWLSKLFQLNGAVEIQ